MKILSNRITAIFLSILMILAGIYIGGRSSLTKLREAAEEIFYQGENRDGFGINYDLEKRIGLANNLLVVAKRYLDSSDPKIADVASSIEALNSADDPSDKYKANNALTDSCYILYDYLTSITLEGEDLRYVVNIKTDLESRNMIIDHSEYNTEAARFNEQLKKFPANIISIYCSVKPLELFK